MSFTRHPLLRIALGALAFIGTACVAQDGTGAQSSTLATYLGSGNSCQVNWSYSGAKGPSNWYRIESDYLACADHDTDQSPVNLVARGPSPEPMATLALEYNAAAVQMQNNSRTYTGVSDDFGTVSLLGEDWTLIQFHMHFPSEHQIDGQSFDGEFHLVHQSVNAPERIAVVAVMVLKKDGVDNPAFEALRGKLPGKQCDVTQLAGYDPTGILPSSLEYFQYSGSLTTPPCTSNVQWFVLQTPVLASHHQVDAFKKIGRNNRPIQKNAFPIWSSTWQ